MRSPLTALVYTLPGQGGDWQRCVYDQRAGDGLRLLQAVGRVVHVACVMAGETRARGRMLVAAGLCILQECMYGMCSLLWGYRGVAALAA